MTGQRKRQRKPITVTVDPRSVKTIDELVAKGLFMSRSQALDHGMDLIIHEHKKMMKNKWWYREAFGRR
jgi:Arc/MetJ-type ribon-helix-helix transcriptional regulator